MIKMNKLLAVIVEIAHVKTFAVYSRLSKDRLKNFKKSSPTKSNSSLLKYFIPCVFLMLFASLRNVKSNY